MTVCFITLTKSVARFIRSTAISFNLYGLFYSIDFTFFVENGLKQSRKVQWLLSWGYDCMWRFFFEVYKYLFTNKYHSNFAWLGYTYRETSGKHGKFRGQRMKLHRSNFIWEVGNFFNGFKTCMKQKFSHWMYFSYISHIVLKLEEQKHGEKEFIWQKTKCVFVGKKKLSFWFSRSNLVHKRIRNSVSFNCKSIRYIY